jgi:TPR repeat protein
MTSAGVAPGVSGQVTLPDRAAETDPGRTAEHAFRAGLREAVFLRRMAADEAARAGSEDWHATESARVLRVWATVGRHVPFGLWAIYGARLGLLLPDVLPGWDPRRVNDYRWLGRLWADRVRPRFRSGAGWRWDWLAEDTAELGRRLGLPELDAAASQRIAESERLSPDRPAPRLDSVGYRLARGTPTPAEVTCARDCFQTAAALDHPAAFLNLGLLHARGLLPDAGEAAWLLRVAAALGDPHAPARLAALLETRADLRGGEAERPARTACALDDGPLALRLDPGFLLAPEAARHVPDPADIPEGRIVGYLSRSEVTGRALPLGVRIARRDTPDGPAQILRPVVLGHWPAPATAEAALADGARAAAAGGADPEWATLGRDAPFGDHFVIGCLAAALGIPVGRSAGRHDRAAGADRGACRATWHGGRSAGARLVGRGKPRRQGAVPSGTGAAALGDRGPPLCARGRGGLGPPAVRRQPMIRARRPEARQEVPSPNLWLPSRPKTCVSRHAAPSEGRL